MNNTFSEIRSILNNEKPNLIQLLQLIENSDKTSIPKQYIIDHISNKNLHPNIEELINNKEDWNNLFKSRKTQSLFANSIITFSSYETTPLTEDDRVKAWYQNILKELTKPKNKQPQNPDIYIKINTLIENPYKKTDRIEWFSNILDRNIYIFTKTLLSIKLKDLEPEHLETILTCKNSITINKYQNNKNPLLKETSKIKRDLEWKTFFEKYIFTTIIASL